MPYEERRTVVRSDDPGYGDVPEREVIVARDTGYGLAGRIVAFIFGLIELVIVLRIVLLLLGARTGNELVRAILDLSQPLVAPFVGIFQVDALRASGSTLDLAAVAALIGWLILELVVLALIRALRREP